MNWPKIRNPFKSHEDVDILDPETDAEQSEKEREDDEEEIDLGGISFGAEISPVKAPLSSM